MEELNQENFYQSYIWKKTRASIIARDHFECQACALRGGFSHASVVHHIIPLEMSEELSLSPYNLVALCRDCHERIHGREKKEDPIPEWW